MSYTFFPKERVATFDCDDTLILWEPDKYVHSVNDLIQLGDENINFVVLPHFRNIEFLKKLKIQGYTIIIWSAAGAEWAQKVTKLLTLEEYTDVVMAKPELAVDDLLDAKRIIKSVVWIDPNTGEFRRNE